MTTTIPATLWRCDRWAAGEEAYMDRFEPSWHDNEDAALEHKEWLISEGVKAEHILIWRTSVHEPGQRHDACGHFWDSHGDGGCRACPCPVTGLTQMPSAAPTVQQVLSGVRR